jgi:hypothetical protein
MRPEPSFVMCSFPPTRGAHGLTRETTTDHVHRLHFLAGEGFHVLVTGDVRPVLRQHLPTIGVGLTLPHDAESCLLEAKV